MRLTDVTAGYPGHPVLHQLTAEIAESALTSVVGPNGSGKSTLLAVLAGVIRPTAGTVTREGTERPAFVVQRSVVSDALPLTVRETVAMGRWARLGPWRRSTARDRAAVEECMERLGVTALAGRRLGELSGGQRQRVLVAQGLAQESDLLLLDEPTTGLDVDSREAVTEVLAELPEQGVTVVQATHDLEAALRSETCLALDDGHLTATGPPADVLPERITCFR
ncbi:zinc ABC transporter ATP-binding protein AztA [Streptomyces sp. DSM 42041]|uniref:Zinc ABC transporter ATP-binding protein AztA n=1 Tax=Streptomyces hazeniae TaxID=3075538 RepID=A0ABU2NQJ5_9ACTN|nr:zinc ABC transporter ATP-binding protein AztA [Streptomyces sp. DSM 42041]MDT0379246.1 zinc ABC transporter ATP-binding protein AztA [Streptomyces sp. DSM 42041]